MRSLFLLLFVAALTACATQTSAELGKPFDLKVGTRAELGSGVSLEFLELLSDSRCPASVQCVWAGEASVRLQLNVSGQSRAIELSTNPTQQRPSEVTVLGYRVKLLDVAPYPAKTDSQDPMGTTAKVQVEKQN